MNNITPVQDTNNIRYADFIRVTTTTKINAVSIDAGNTYTIFFVGTTDFTLIGAASNTVGVTFVASGAGTGTGIATQEIKYLFSTAPASMTIPAVDSQAFSGVGQLVQVGNAARDIKSTANETTFSLVGIDTALLGWVLGQDVKGSKIEAWHGFYNVNGTLITTGGTGGLYKFFTGNINSFSISEQWMEEVRMMTGIIQVSASSIQIILQNRVAGRFTNNNSWQFFTPGDTSMDRVSFISTINYPFGKTA
jgi:hypothetical protein